MEEKPSRVLRRQLCATLPMAIALLAGGATSASAVRVIDVRVGQHGEFTRVVFDLDGPARYRMERSEAGASAPELVLHFDASAQPKAVRTLSKVIGSVRLEARPEGSVARIALRSPDVHTVEETLSSPPRIVIDVRASTPAEAAAAKPTAAAPPETPEAPAPAAAPPPTPAAPPPATVRPPRTTAEVIEAQADAAAARLLDGQRAPKPGESPAASGGAPPASPQAATGLAEGPAAPAEAASPPAPAVPPPGAEAPRETGNPPGTLGAPPPPPPLISPFSEPGRVVTGAVLLVLGVFVWFLVRRRDSDQAAHAGALPADAFLDRMSAFGDGGEHAVEEPLADTEERTEALPLFAAASTTERTGEVQASERSVGAPQDSLFGGSSSVALVGDKGPSGAAPEGPGLAPGEHAMGSPVASASHTEESAARALRDLEQRLALIEQRLARDADARERLERQVVAQTEELRVQRAAIARTQRVLRTLSRPEDLATEPVIKSPGPSSGSPD
jgi:hypothetical protein